VYAISTNVASKNMKKIITSQKGSRFSFATFVVAVELGHYSSLK
jgi:hypothetical protein